MKPTYKLQNETKTNNGAPNPNPKNEDDPKNEDISYPSNGYHLHPCYMSLCAIFQSDYVII